LKEAKVLERWLGWGLGRGRRRLPRTKTMSWEPSGNRSRNNGVQNWRALEAI
jgi:hypothetical protein